MNITYAHINAYVKGLLSKDLVNLVETEADKNPKIIKMIEERRDEIVLMKSLIPAHKSSEKTSRDILSDLELISDEIIQVEEVGLLQRVAKVLDTTVLEF